MKNIKYNKNCSRLDYDKNKKLLKKMTNKYYKLKGGNLIMSSQITKVNELLKLVKKREIVILIVEKALEFYNAQGFNGNNDKWDDNTLRVDPLKDLTIEIEFRFISEKLKRILFMLLSINVQPNQESDLMLVNSFKTQDSDKDISELPINSWKYEIDSPESQVSSLLRMTQESFLEKENVDSYLENFSSFNHPHQNYLPYKKDGRCYIGRKFIADELVLIFFPEMSNLHNDSHLNICDQNICDQNICAEILTAIQIDFLGNYGHIPVEIRISMFQTLIKRYNIQIIELIMSQDFRNWLNNSH